MEKELRLTDLVDVEILQKIQDSFSNMTGIAALTTDADGIAVTRGSKFSEFCMKYTRNSKIGCAHCQQCDKYGAELAWKKGRSITYYCHAGLVDFAAPIMADDKIIGCFIGGQILTEPPKEDKIRAIAEKIGVNPDEYMEAAKNVNIIPKENIDKAAQFLYSIASILSDITYSRYQVYQANIEIEKAANMKSDFLANMSHEIRTPMNAVIGMADMALREDLPQNAREYINEIKSAGRSLLTIINDILDFSKIESGKMDIVPAEYEPMSIVHDVTNIIMTRLQDKNVELILDVNPDIPYKLYGDFDRIKQVVLNLASNAVKFTNEGKIVLHMEFEKRAEEDIILKVAVEDTGIGIKKEDMGKLFQSFQQLDSKRNRNIEGTGLGLAISRQLLTLMKGSIDVKSEYGKGSTFSFEIPQKIIDERGSISIKGNRQIVAAGLVGNEYVREQLRISAERLGVIYVDLNNEEDVRSIYKKGVEYLFMENAYFSDGMKDFIRENPHITAVLISDFRGNPVMDIKNMRFIRKPVCVLNMATIFNNETVNYGNSEKEEAIFDFIAPDAEILIVDDNAINLTVAEGLLEPLKMKIDTAASGKEAVEKISQHRYDIVFMDHMMPDMDGVETTHVIRRFFKEYQDMPIVALTANAVGGTMEMFLKEGMNDFVAKPIELRILVSKVKRWLPKEKVQKQSAKRDEVAEQATCDLPVIGNLDVASAYKRLGSEKLFWSVLWDYYRVIPQKIKAIKKFEEEENWSAYTIEVHALKSSSKQIGANAIAEKAAVLEKAGNEADEVMIYAETDDMLKEYGALIPVLRPFFEETGKIGDTDATESAPLIEQETLKQYFGELRAAMEDLDIDVMESILEKMKGYRYGSECHSLFNSLKDAVDNIDVDKCETIIKKWENIKS